MSEELQAFVNALIDELESTGNDQIRTATLIHCIKRAAQEVENGSEDGPDIGDGYDDWD